MLTVALTGGFQTGKTTVLSMFEKCGAKVLSADHVVHRELECNVVLARSIKKTFGPHVFKDGKIDRCLLAQRVFSDKKSLEKLNQLVHPYVRKEIISFFQKCYRKHKHNIVVVEVPLLFETGFEKFFDVTAVVFTKARITGERLAKQHAFTPLEKVADFNRRSLLFEADGGLKPLSAQIGRELRSLPGFTFKDMKTRNAHQFSLTQKMVRCDFVIDNNTGLKRTFFQVREFMAFLGPLRGLGLGRIRKQLF